MKYYIIAGEASGDLHASHLIKAIRQLDAAASFRCIGGDKMAGEGAELLMHYRDLAYMGFLPVLRHLPTILRGLHECQSDILRCRPDVLVLVDYPGFNLRIARFVRQHSHIPVAYYIAPKIWAWKEHRIHSIRRDVDCLLSILPFEKRFYEEKHGYPIHYVGNPTLDEVGEDVAGTASSIALLPGSRRQEVEENLPRMVEAAKPFAEDYPLVLAAAPGLNDAFYEKQVRRAIAACQRSEPNDVPWTKSSGQSPTISIVRDQTYEVLRHSAAALVTSGTATLETALLGVPQVVCYHTKAPRLVSLVRRLVLKVPYVSLVNLIVGQEVVPELIAHQMTAASVRHHLTTILPGGPARQAQLEGYARLRDLLGKPGAAARAAKIITSLARPAKAEEN